MLQCCGLPKVTGLKKWDIFILKKGTRIEAFPGH